MLNIQIWDKIMMHLKEGNGQLMFAKSFKANLRLDADTTLTPIGLRTLVLQISGVKRTASPLKLDQTQT